MRITDFNSEPIAVLPFLNAGRRPGEFYKDSLPVYHGCVEQLPDGVDAILATADLQGRQMLSRNPRSPAKLVGEVLPRLLEESLLDLGIDSPKRVLTLLGGDFYTYPDLRGRGGTGDVTPVWEAMSDNYGWVVGVTGNHDMFGEQKSYIPDFAPPTHVLDAERIEIEGISIAGISGVIGNPAKNFRRDLPNHLDVLELILMDETDILVMHDGPDAPNVPRCRGDSDVRAVIERCKPSLVVRGHSHWSQPLVELTDDVQVLNVDATVAILTRPG